MHATRHLGEAVVLAVAAVVASATACHHSYVVEVGELAKLNQVAHWKTSGPTQTNTNQQPHQPGWTRASSGGHDESRVQIERPTGDLVTIEGTADDEIVTTDGRTYRFDHPVSVWMNADSVTLATADEPPMTFEFDWIAEARVIQNPQLPFEGFFAGNNTGGLTIFRW